ncbi:acyl-CoA carboxylase subunit epsilon [Streptomyces sp. NBC_01218]|uniref:acyl-CoA carboxylase epsilon subunit n=1 Tax=unclassified Streptomyces TaxID=2593676 RepID=UPI0023B971EC|nr:MULTISPECIES: acyl-CoA carboxylase epsilon subunit [unclassified Streptomyces]WEH39071.1 acyl-CoA carboxylase epsilon subunit [Streptomyces sp. AM 2-1-1]WSQ50727.1 acyl-CoA carboxylase subunit epsilon [Streptomyces sp. NBC_01218]
MSPLTPFPLPARAEDPSAPAAQVPALRILRGDPTPEEVAAVTAALLAALPRPSSGPAIRVRQAARWSRPHSTRVTGSWRAAGPR